MKMNGEITDFGLAKLIDSKQLDADRSRRRDPVIWRSRPLAGLLRSVLVATFTLWAQCLSPAVRAPPLIGDSPIQLAMQIMKHEPPPLRLLEPSLDRDLEMIVSRCIQKPPGLRYASADDLADDLEVLWMKFQARSGNFPRSSPAGFARRIMRSSENWGLLWMWHSLVLLLVSFLTELMPWNGVQNRASYAGLWTLGLGTWAFVFWALRHRMGPVTFVERQIAHVWGASLMAIAMLTPLEWLLNLKPLTLSPMLPMIGSTVFVVKAGILSGRFYLQALAMLMTSFAMALYPNFAHLIFGVVSASCFFIPGLKYFRQRYHQSNGKLIDSLPRIASQATPAPHARERRSGGIGGPGTCKSIVRGRFPINASVWPVGRGCEQGSR